MRLNDETAAMSSLARQGSGRDELTEATDTFLTTPGVAGFLEIEEEPPRAVADNTSSFVGGEAHGEADLLGLSYEPVRTSSGLILTHRRTPPVDRRPLERSALSPGSDEDKYRARTFLRVPGVSVSANNTSFEVDADRGRRRMADWRNLTSAYSVGGQSNGLAKATRILSFVRLWVAVFCLVLLVGTGVAIKSIRHEAVALTGTEEQKDGSVQEGSDTSVAGTGEFVDEGREGMNRVILLPLDSIPELALAEDLEDVEEESRHRGSHRRLHDLRREFEEWVTHHKKTYHSEEEKERRFSIWSDNHHKTMEKNKRHGPCKLSKQPVFGSNHFKDLTTEEFQSQFLTGYNGPTTDKLEGPALRTTTENRRHQRKKRTFGSNVVRPTSRGSGHVLGTDEPLSAVDRHPDIQKQLLAYWDAANLERNTYVDPVFKASYSSCRWYDVSCWLRWFFNTYGYGIGGVMTPSYDGSYPSAVDWREMGVVTDVHSQGNCGACWAITAVESIESAYAMKTGTLMDLSETEVIVCDDSCDMCNGGWPQNAYEYAMDHNGLQEETSYSYDGDFLLALTMVLAGESDELSSDYVQSYMYEMCPDGGSHSGDNGNDNVQRYAKIGGYGYATERCICYTDGTGCDCDDQNELMAVRNLASYGPATVCLEASLWQDYAGGIMTSSIGCGSTFLDMNHCVQAVGYAFVDLDEEEGDEQGSNSHSGSNSGGSQDSGNREGYWIIRNQWSSSWGMNGYAYVAMGENTCGVLNDMTQAYM